MKSFANIHKTPVFILFISPKKHHGWNQFTTDPVVRDATVIIHTERRNVSDDTERLFPRPENYRNEKRGEKQTK